MGQYSVTGSCSDAQRITFPLVLCLAISYKLLRDKGLTGQAYNGKVNAFASDRWQSMLDCGLTRCVTAKRQSLTGPQSISIDMQPAVHRLLIYFSSNRPALYLREKNIVSWAIRKRN